MLVHEISIRPEDAVDPYADELEVDVLIAGAGFGGLFLLHEMRKEGYQTVVYEQAAGIGGTWRWNVHPGSRVDSEIPAYELSIPEVWKDWTWSTNFPSYAELQRYFDHVDKVLNLSKDCAFKTTIVGADFNEGSGKWSVRTHDGRICKCRFFIVATGFTTKRFVPKFKCIEKYRGRMYHSSDWPKEDVDVRGKRCAVIGTGPSGVQIVQEWSSHVGDLKVFQRTPNFAIPMRRREITPDEQNKLKPLYPKLFAHRELSYSGFTVDMAEKNTFDVSEQEREAFYEKLWSEGSFSFWLSNFKDYLTDYKANREAYKFWARKQRAHIHDVRKRDLLCPLDPPPHYLFGIKRPCLEQRYYEQFNKPNIDIINVAPSCGGQIEIAEFTETGIVMTDGVRHDFDVIALATGFDITTGGITELGLRSTHGTYLKDEWKTTAYSYLGTTISGYPNLFYLYGPQGPMVLSNGAATVEIQGRWIRDVIRMIKAQDLKYIEPTKEATLDWKERINELSHKTLFSSTPRSTYMGGGIPGKAPQQVNYTGGLGKYKEEIRAVLPTWRGFRIVKESKSEAKVSATSGATAEQVDAKMPMTNGFATTHALPNGHNGHEGLTVKNHAFTNATHTTKEEPVVNGHVFTMGNEIRDGQSPTDGLHSPGERPITSHCPITNGQPIASEQPGANGQIEIFDQPQAETQSNAREKANSNELLEQRSDLALVEEQATAGQSEIAMRSREVQDHPTDVDFGRSDYVSIDRQTLDGYVTVPVQ